jgi:hypothetical protein
MRSLPPHTCTRYIDEVWAFDTTPDLVNGSPPSAPVTYWHSVGMYEEPLADAPQVSGTDVLQRMRNLTTGQYHLHITFITDGMRRDIVMDVTVEG